MPYAVRAETNAAPDVVGAAARVGDVRSHIFRIGDSPEGFRAFLTDDGASVRLDAQGRAALTADYVCLRCHDGNGIFNLTLERAAEIAPNVHRLP
jgi:hypothetical protein